MKKGISIYGFSTGDYTILVDDQVWSMTGTPTGHECKYLGPYGLQVGRVTLKVNASWGKKLALTDLDSIARGSFSRLLQDLLTDPDYTKATMHSDNEPEFVMFRGFRIDDCRKTPHGAFKIRHRDMGSYTMGSYKSLNAAKQALRNSGVYNTDK